MENRFVNLDVLRCESVTVQFLGKQFEVGYIPSGIAIPVLENHNQNLATQTEHDSQEKLINDTVKSVAIFCSFYEPEFTEEYIKKHTTVAQLEAMYQHIVTAIVTTFPVDAAADAADTYADKKKLTGER